MANFPFAPQSMGDTSSSFKSCFPFTEMDFVNQYTELQSIILDNSNSNMIGICSNQEDGLSKNFANDINNNDCTGSLTNPGPFGSVLVDGIHETKTKATKRKNTAASENSSGLSFEEKAASKSNSGRGKRGKRTVQNSSTVGGEVKKPKEVIHVRARRGQATDSHSLAERVRREKINERMRCLHDLVPGCYKTMGKAVMLDEIINYVQSLQNQVEISTKFSDVLAFGGRAPERINGRLAMVGFVAAMAVELTKGDDLASQLASGGLWWFAGATALLSLASLVPMFKGVSVQARSGGVMTSHAEMWNGRFAMIGLVALVFTEYLKGGALI